VTLIATIATTPPLLILTITLGYALLCTASPFGTCRRCHGQPPARRRALTPARILGGGSPYRRVCRRCHGSGIRLRLGRRLYNHLRRLSLDARR
jgi:hypothetical protein